MLPDRTPPALAQRCSELNADVVICGETLEDATNYAKKVHMETGQFLLRYTVYLFFNGTFRIVS